MSTPTFMTCERCRSVRACLSASECAALAPSDITGLTPMTGQRMEEIRRQPWLMCGEGDELLDEVARLRRREKLLETVLGSAAMALDEHGDMPRAEMCRAALTPSETAGPTPRHICGEPSFDDMQGDRCPACGWRAPSQTVATPFVPQHDDAPALSVMAALNALWACVHDPSGEWADTVGAISELDKAIRAAPSPVSPSPAVGEPPQQLHDVRYFVEAMVRAAELLGSQEGLDTKLLASAHLLNWYAEQARSSPTPGDTAR